jgi:hypothetical protein
MQTLEDLYNKELQNEKFALLVSARVNEILSGKAKALDFSQSGKVRNAYAEETLLFADLIARSVCQNLNKEGDSSE